MKPILQFLKTTVVGGVVFLIPVVVLTVVVGEALGVARGVLAPVVARLPEKTVGGVALVTLLAAAALVLLCFLAGLVARTSLAGRAVARLEERFLSPIPGYRFMKSMRSSVLGVNSGREYEVVLAQIAGGWQMAFLVERVSDTQVAVFVPGAPNAWSGQLYFVESTQVKSLDAKAPEALGCVERLGEGAKEILGRHA